MVEMSESTVSAANDVIADPAPRMSPAPVTAVSLIRGIKVGDEWYDEATVRELNGEDEEAIASLVGKPDLVYSDYMSTLLKRAVVNIGDVSIADNPSAIDSLIIGDRDLLFIGAMRATYGRFRELEVSCGNCNVSNLVTLNLEEDFKFEMPDGDFTKPREITMKDGSVVKIDYPTGADSSYVTKKAKTTAEQNTLMIARCTVWDDDDRPANLEKWAKKLGVSDRNKLVRALTNNPPGPQMEEVKTQCADCGEDLIILMDWVSLLFG